jgi:hypothetical protein
VDRGEDRRMMSERIWEKRRFKIGVRWLWIEKAWRRIVEQAKTHKLL